MLRPFLAFLTLCLAAFLLAPTVASVHEKVTDLHFDRDTPWEIWKWTDEPSPMIPFPDCSKKEHHLYSEITQWPAKIRKDEAFTLRGIVQSEEMGREGVALIDVDVFLNETKTEPGVFLGKAETGPGGFFTIMTSVPFELEASHYHIVAHAKQKQIDCNFYFEHWSDPETDVVSKTHVEWEPVEHAVAGREIIVAGRVVDAVGAPVRNATLNVTYNGKSIKLTTNSEGAFRFNHTPSKPGNFTITAEYKGGEYYEGTKNQTVVDVALEELVLDGATDPIPFVRSQTATLSGHVYVADAARKDEILLTFNGTRVATCLECPPNATIRAPVQPDGSFSVNVVVPPSQPGASATLVVSGGGLQKARTFNVTVDVPTSLTFDARGTGLFSKRFEANATLLDETGRPLAAPIAIRTPTGWSTNQTDANGTVLLSGEAPCGRHVMEAHFNGTSHVVPTSAQKETLVCSYLAFIPGWILAIPWWVWPLAAIAGFAAWRIARKMRQTYSPVILAGPPLLLSFTEPADEAIGYAGVGEAVVATAFLESPLPDGHTLRMGTSRATTERPLDAELRAHLRIVPEKLGTIPVRAEIVDAKGHVVSRRTVPLHVVRYAQEIERRYLALRASSGASDDVTPREFERWLHERAPGLSPDLTRRLVHVFEEADYSPRTAGRAEFAAYLAAETGVEEVRRDVAIR